MEIKELTEVVDFAIDFGNGLGQALEDHQITLSDLGDFLPALRSAMPAFAGIGNVDDELMDITDDEVQVLVQHVITKFDIPGDKAEKIVEEALELGLKIFLFVKSNFMKVV